MVDKDVVRKIVEDVLSSVLKEMDSPGSPPAKESLVPINMSNRHVHIKKEHLEQLFGPGAALKTLRPLMQPGEFASELTVTIVGPCGVIRDVRLLGPVRNYTQVEISLTDCFALGIKSPLIRDSGAHRGTPGITLVGPVGSVTIMEGLIIAQRHLHLHTIDAEKLGFKDGQWARVRTSGPRGLVFENVLVRVKESYALEMHIDVDEANACALKPGEYGIICL
jgi:putative phosphotransacetylase